MLLEQLRREGKPFIAKELKEMPKDITKKQAEIRRRKTHINTG